MAGKLDEGEKSILTKNTSQCGMQVNSSKDGGTAFVVSNKMKEQVKQFQEKQENKCQPENVNL